jgi:DNA-binding CsgD family transcriptional regulator
LAGPEVPGTTVRGTTDTNDARFTIREMTILELIAKGLTNLQIAGELHISKYTVAQHVAKMLERSGARNRTDLVSRSYTAGILQSASMTPETLRNMSLQLGMQIHAHAIQKADRMSLECLGNWEDDALRFFGNLRIQAGCLSQYHRNCAHLRDMRPRSWVGVWE